MKYIVIDKLVEFCSMYEIEVNILDSKYLDSITSYPQITFSIKNKTFIFYVDDEYEDLKIGSHLLSNCIALRTLESYNYADDYLVWCIEHSFEAGNNEVRDHYQNLGKIVSWFSENHIPINSFISDYDFELNAGAAQFLRNKSNFTV